MNKKEKILVFSIGFLLLAVFTFTDLQISMACYSKNVIARVLEVTGEVPFMFLALFGSVLIFKFRSRKNLAVNIIVSAVSVLLTVFLAFMGGFMTWNYLRENIGDISVLTAALIGFVLFAGAILLAANIPEEYAHKAMTFAITAIVYMLLVLIVMNVLKACWGRMRMREMTEPLEQFTRWYVITNRGGFDNTYASFPSGHAMNSAAVILLTLLPSFVPALKGREKLLKIISYTWLTLVGASRVVMGAHFSSDVVIGIMLSLVLFEVSRTGVSKMMHETLSES